MNANKGNENENKKPVAKFRDGALSAAVWRREGEKDGRKWQAHDVTLQRAFFDDEKEEWNYSESIPKNDMLAASELLRLAYRFAVKCEAEFRAAQNAAADNPEVDE